MTVFASALGASAIVAEALEPDRDDARDQVLEELAKPGYRNTDPGWIEALGKAISDFFGQFSFEVGGTEVNWLLILLVVLGVIAVIAAILVFGRPKLSAVTPNSTALFGDEDLRGLDALRRAAEEAAARGDFGLAILERFRAIARALDERTVVLLSPGTTAGEFGRRAAAAFPAEAGGLLEAARSFDRVRYASLPGSETEYQALAALDGRLAAAAPARLEALAGVGA